MRNNIIPSLVVAVTFMMLAIPAVAQPGMNWRGSGGWGPSGPYVRMYDPATVETVSGEVVEVQQFLPGRGMHHGVHLLLKTDKETVSVHLGPVWYIENQDLKIEPKDRIEVKGSRITFDGKPAIAAAEIRKGEETLILRDQNGVPSWSGWRRR